VKEIEKKLPEVTKNDRGIRRIQQQREKIEERV